MEEVLRNDGQGSVVDEAERVKDALALLVRVSGTKLKGTLAEMMNMVNGTEWELLKCTLSEEQIKVQFPEKILREGGFMEGAPRLRHERDGHWLEVINGRDGSDWVPEIYNYLRLVRIPKLAFRILEAMDEQPEAVLVALTDVQYGEYCSLKDLAHSVLKNAVETLGMDRAASLMKITESYKLRDYTS